MINNQKIVVCLPAYNAAKTLTRTFREIPRPLVDEVILVDDASDDETIAVANELGIHHIIRHSVNRGYGANQKTCYKKALELDADIIIMLHPDYQYNPALIPSFCYLISERIYPVVLGSRILGRGALKQGMPLYKYISNRALTFLQNILLAQKLSEYHTGYRAYCREVFSRVRTDLLSDDYLFDNQFLSVVLYAGYEVGEISCPAHYFPEASSINFRRSVKYGFGVLYTSLLFRLNKWNICRSAIFRGK